MGHICQMIHINKFFNGLMIMILNIIFMTLFILKMIKNNNNLYLINNLMKEVKNLNNLNNNNINIYTHYI